MASDAHAIGHPDGLLAGTAGRQPTAASSSSSSSAYSNPYVSPELYSQVGVVTAIPSPTKRGLSPGQREASDFAYVFTPAPESADRAFLTAMRKEAADRADVYAEAAKGHSLSAEAAEMCALLIRTQTELIECGARCMDLQKTAVCESLSDAVRALNTAQSAMFYALLASSIGKRKEVASYFSPSHATSE